VTVRNPWGVGPEAGAAQAEAVSQAHAPHTLEALVGHDKATEIFNWTGVSGCLLCGSPTEFIGLFVPDARTRKKLGVPKGKLRQIFYGLCGEHYQSVSNGSPAAIDRIMRTARA